MIRISALSRSAWRMWIGVAMLLTAVRLGAGGKPRPCARSATTSHRISMPPARSPETPILTRSL